MGKKYIIELLDDCNSEFKGIMVFGLTQEKQISVELIPEESMTPYNAPDLEQVRKEAYQSGLDDMREAIKKISNMRVTDRLETFGTQYTENCLETHTTSEILEKIRQYEEKEEIRIGDEVEDGVANLIVLEINEDGTVSGFDDEGSIIHATPRKKTGRHFPEIAEALQKMKENNDNK